MKTKLVMIAFALIFAITAASAEDFDSLVEQARSQAAAGAFTDAMKTLDRASVYANASQRPLVFVERGEVLLRQGKLIDALSQFDSAVKSAPDQPCMRTKRALFYASTGAGGAAQAEAETAASLGCASSELTSLRAGIFISHQNYVDAISILSELLTDPDFKLTALRQTGLAYLLLGYSRTSLDYLKEAEKLSPDDSQIQAMLADCNLTLARFDDAMKNYKRAIDLGAEDESVRNNYGYAMFMSGKKEQARDYFLKYKRRKQSFYSFCNLMEINLSLENYPEAAAASGMCVNSASEDGLEDFERYYLLAVNHAVTTLYQDHLQLHPQTQLDLAVQYEKQGRLAEAISCALTALMLDPTNKNGLFIVGSLYSKLGDYPKAASNLNAYISLAGPGGEFTYEAHKILFKQSSLSSECGFSSDSNNQ